MTDWKARAEREAAALLDSAAVTSGMFVGYDDLVSLCAAAWLQGVNLGSHETLAQAEEAFYRLKDCLS